MEDKFFSTGDSPVIEEIKPNLIFRTGNIFDSNCECLVNPVNTVGVMGAGLAAQFKKNYPNMFKLYKQACDQSKFDVGRIMFYKDIDDNAKIICLFPTKIHWKESSKIEYVESGLKAFCKYYTEWKVKSVAFPKLGCGLGGLNWDYHVKPMMIKYLSQLPIMIEVYE